MGDPVTTMLAVAGTTLKAGSQIKQAQAQSAALEAQAAQADLQAQAEATQAARDELKRQEELRRVLATQNAAFGASGGGSPSGSQLAIMQDTTSLSNRAGSEAKAFSKARQRQFTAQAEQDRSAASSTRTIGYINAASTLASGGSRIYDRATTPGTEE
jgi:hypothetical protein